MKIDDTEFGSITIAGKSYQHDVVIRLSDKVVRIPGSVLFADGNAKNFRGEPYLPGALLVALVAGR